MKFHRTPEERFADLPSYPFEPNYVEIAGLRMHYIDEGQTGDEIVLMLHGEPSWSYLYRKMVPPVAQAGCRVIVPDLIGFGKSDKPVQREAYTYQSHMDWLAEFVRVLDLKDITLVCQDWGGLLGLRLAAEDPTRFKRIVAANTFLMTGVWTPSEAFSHWRDYAQKTEHFRVGKIVNSGCVSDLSPEIIAAYDAPFPDESYKAGARQFPLLVPITLDDPGSPPSRKAWEALSQWDKPFLTAFSDSDPITRGADAIFQKLIPGAQNQKHTTIKSAGHFLQEDKGEELAEVIIRFIEEN